mmetsp:Transcript_27108/g.55218  ORF Transcript_27108/g.55218 Transcript_27108/m.55218 type:complete len:217 (+) Transcript_27108:660-1310(+)
MDRQQIFERNRSALPGPGADAVLCARSFLHRHRVRLAGYQELGPQQHPCYFPHHLLLDEHPALEPDGGVCSPHPRLLLRYLLGVPLLCNLRQERHGHRRHGPRRPHQDPGPALPVLGAERGAAVHAHRAGGHRVAGAAAVLCHALRRRQGMQRLLHLLRLHHGGVLRRADDLRGGGGLVPPRAARYDLPRAGHADPLLRPRRLPRRAPGGVGRLEE